MKDIEKKLFLCEEMGIKIIQGSQGATSRFAYFGTNEIGGVRFELIQQEKEEFSN